MMICIGLTGNIGSGKSTVASCFQSLGIEVISADAIARELTRPGEKAYERVKAYFGDEAILPEGEINRKILRQRIFSDKQDRIWLEKLLHPLIKKKIEEKVQQVRSPYCIIEIPLLTKREDYPYLNRVLLIYADYQKQIDRIVKRDHCTKEEVASILASQLGYEILEKLADDVLVNEGSREELEVKVRDLHERYLLLVKDQSSRV